MNPLDFPRPRHEPSILGANAAGIMEEFGKRERSADLDCLATQSPSASATSPVSAEINPPLIAQDR